VTAKEGPPMRRRIPRHGVGEGRARCGGRPTGLPGGVQGLADVSGGLAPSPASPIPAVSARIPMPRPVAHRPTATSERTSPRLASHARQGRSSKGTVTTTSPRPSASAPMRSRRTGMRGLAAPKRGRPRNADDGGVQEREGWPPGQGTTP
jgi:hypothetical protein